MFTDAACPTDWLWNSTPHRRRGGSRDVRGTSELCRSEAEWPRVRGPKGGGCSVGAGPVVARSRSGPAVPIRKERAHRLLDWETRRVPSAETTNGQTFTVQRPPPPPHTIPRRPLRGGGGGGVLGLGGGSRVSSGRVQTAEVGAAVTLIGDPGSTRPRDPRLCVGSLRL